MSLSIEVRRAVRARSMPGSHRWLALSAAMLGAPCFAVGAQLPPPAEPVQAAPAWPHLNEGIDVELRIVELRIRERGILAPELLAYIDEAGHLYLPLGTLASLLDFPVEVKADGRTSGWFLREHQNFILDPANRTATIAGRAVAVEDGQVAWIDNEVHIRSDALDAWLLLKPSWQSERQIVRLNPPYLIASEENARRVHSGARASRFDAIDVEGFLPIDSGYRWIGWPFVHGNFALGYDTQTAPRLSLQGALLAEGDLFKHSARIALSADSRGFVDGRITMGRHDSTNRLLGPARASLFEFGDISAPHAPLLQRGAFGIGVRIARETADLGGNFDQIDLMGSAPPGWQAELYRDSELLGFQIVGADGRYDFRDAPLAFGVSRFRIQLYGPSGERQTIHRTVDVDAASLRSGELRYSLLAMRQGHSLLNGAGADRDRFDPIDSGGLPGLFDRNATYLEARASRGLSRKLAIRSVASYRRPDDRNQPDRASLGLGARLSLGRVLVDSDAIVQNGGAWAGRTAAMVGLGRFRLTASHDQYDRDFISDENGFTNSPLRSRSALSLDGALGAVGMGAQFIRIDQHDGIIDQSANVRMNMLLAGFSFTNRLGWRRFSGPATTRERIDGSFGFSGAAGPMRARFGADYEIEDNRLRARRLRGEVSYRLDRWYLAVGHDRELQRGGFGQWNATATRDWNGVRLGGELRYVAPRGDVRALLTIGFAMDRDPANGRLRFGRSARSQRGTLDIGAFHDANANGRWDADEAEVYGLSVESDPRGLRRAGEGSARVRIEELPVSQQVALRPMLDAIDDPYLIAAVPGYLVSPRPGQAVRIDIPLIESGEVELMIVDADGNPLASERAALRRCDSDATIRRESSAFDGRIFFDRIPPGCYHIDGLFDPTQIIVEPGSIARAGLRRAGF